MKFYRYIITLFFISTLFSCDETILITGIEGEIICDVSEIEVSASDNIVIADDESPVFWQGTYTDNSVKISYTKNAGTDGETETLAFVFNKKDGCLQIDRCYKYYYGSVADISAVTEMQVFEFKMKDWEIDKKFTGQLVYKDHHDKQTYTINFWVEFTEENYEVEDTNYTYFSDCFDNQLPIDIDLNKDGITDYSIISEEKFDLGNVPNFAYNNIKLISVDESINEIHSPKKSSIPYTVIFEPPFTSEDTKKYDANKFDSEEVKNSLDVFYEFAAPYESYNFFLQNNLTYKKELSNNKDDYYIVKMAIDENSYYGWIKIEFSATECYIAVVDTYLESIPNKHISVD
ncbi:hypothetical protein SAMN05216503_1024 [Polaribacter sp. KT25b]|uniref:hypothetical protein n=1 Tax=Polaribacter sp. KT25b TaxID=1855336 RepID=UPI00087D54F2|nr:hypothetical protein [Polaribacter sp. KT25b]SDR81638.1 hypothetical protein SAMN05216503_1024 [Polaribacter sp. KT25b]